MTSEQVRNNILMGVVPAGLTIGEIRCALRDTRKPNQFEVFGFLSARLRRNGVWRDLGLLSCKLVTTAFADYIVDSLQDSTTYPLDAFHYHASGTDNTAESNTQTALLAEVGTRASGTQTEGSSTNIFKSVGTQTYSSTYTIYEHGLFSASSGGTLLDRSVITGQAVQNNDQIEWTYELTVNAET